MIYNKPTGEVFASQANTGESADFPDVPRGWGITKEQTESKPPMSWMNGAFRRIDENMEYLRQNGIPEWDEKLTYPVGAISRVNSELYLCKAENIDQNPTTSNSWVKLVITEDAINGIIPVASTGQPGIVRLSSAIDSDSETTAATSKAVKDAIASLGSASTKSVGNGVGQIPDMSYFTSGGNASSAEWVKLPNGMIMQFGVTTTAGQFGDATVPFPIAFPNRASTVIIAPTNDFRSIEYTSVNIAPGISKTQFQVTGYKHDVSTGAASYSSVAFHWVSIGF